MISLNHMNEYEKRLEDARRARMQDVRPRTDGAVPPRAPQKNRIEEALGKPLASFTAEAVPVMPPIAPKTAAPVSAVQPLAVQKEGNAYGRFLKKFFLALLALALIAAVGLGGYVVFKMHAAPKTQTPQATIDAAGKLISLPAGETPTVATVSDLAPLKDQPFFKDAQIGDKVLVFKESEKAILYRPSTNKIVTVAPLTGGAEVSSGVAK